jgi:hypothetical protein
VEQLVAQRGDDLRRPEERVLQVDEAACLTDRAQVRLEDAEAAVPGTRVVVLGDGGDDLRLREEIARLAAALKKNVDA